MSAGLVVVQAAGKRRIEPDQLPVVIGGPDADIEVSGAASEAALAFVGVEDGEPFLQPAPGAAGVLCNGNPLTNSQWLRPGDRIRVGTTSVAVERESGELQLRVETRTREVDTEPPLIVPATIGAPTSGKENLGPRVEAVDFQPQSIRRRGGSRWSPHPLLVVTWVALALLGAAAWFLFTARAVEVRVLPEPDRLEVDGSWLKLEIGGRYLLRPGSYRVVAEKEGYRRLEAPVQVTRLPSQVHEFALEKLPGLLQLETVPADGIDVSIDGEAVGSTPLDAIELKPGEHVVQVSSGRFESVTQTIDIAGGGETTFLRIELSPLWAPVSIDSRPPGATVRIDGREIGETPLTADLLEGEHQLELRLAGFKPHRSRLSVIANQPYRTPQVILQPADGRLVLTSEPAGASVSVAGTYRGQTPLELDLAPRATHEISLSKSGHETATDRVQVQSGQTRKIHVNLDPRYGEIEISVDPADAEVLIDGQPIEADGGPLRLTATEHVIEVRKQGYETFRRSLTPRPGFPQVVEVSLKTEEEARLAARTPVIRTVQGQELRLIEPGQFRMGASRREPGRRANEALRDVEITRAFYLATEEVSNQEYREFREGHRSGQAGGKSLDLDDYPVVSVTWEQAARYCNWLSEKEGLPPAYEVRNGRLVGVRPMTTGYRLPTEAEWAWAARFAGNASGRKYAWGDSLPVDEDSGNYADTSAAGIVEATISGYRDGFPVTAPVDSFAPNAVGVFNLGGNVAEWVHDIYSINPGAAGGLQIDPLGPEEGEFHVIRGASWMDSTVTELRLSYRDYGNGKRPDLGFRIARYAE